MEVFGEGKVTTNLLVGLGESDENLLDGVRYFAERGIVATLRPLRINDFNREPLTEAFGPLVPVTAERIVDLATRAKAIMEESGITIQDVPHDVPRVRMLRHRAVPGRLVHFVDPSAA